MPLLLRWLPPAASWTRLSARVFCTRTTPQTASRRSPRRSTRSKAHPAGRPNQTKAGGRHPLRVAASGLSCSSSPSGDLFPSWPPLFWPHETDRNLHRIGNRCPAAGRLLRSVGRRRLCKPDGDCILRRRASPTATTPSALSGFLCSPDENGVWRGKARLTNVGTATNTYSVRFSVIQTGSQDVLGMKEESFTVAPAIPPT